MSLIYDTLIGLVEITPTDDDEFTEALAVKYLDGLEVIATEIQKSLVSYFEQSGELVTVNLTPVQGCSGHGENYWTWGYIGVTDENGDSVDSDTLAALDDVIYIEQEFHLGLPAPSDFDVEVTKDRIKIKFEPLIRTYRNLSKTI